MSLADIIIYESEKSAIASIDNGADVNEFDRYGFRPLIEAVICQKPKVLVHLINAGADIEQLDTLGRTALQWAADKGYIELCDLLLKHKANPNHHSIDGQPILVNPILREQYDLINLFKEAGAKYQFAQDFISAKLVGHRFELSGETDITTPDERFIPLSFEGFYLEFTCDLIKRSVNNFINSMPGDKYFKLKAKINKIIQALQRAGQLISYHKHLDKTPFIDTINALLDNELLIIPVAHKGHALVFIKYQELWIKCDRGVKNFTDTVIIYKTKNPYIVDKDLLKALLYTSKPEDFIEKELKEMLSLKFIQKLPTKSQIAGNCSWANVEASVPAALFALSYMDNEYNESHTAQLKKSIMSFYTSWVEWDKDSALEELIKDFNSAAIPRSISKALILSSIFIQRCHYKIKEEVARAKKIIPCFNGDAFKFILENIRSIYNNSVSGKVGKNIIKLLEICHVDINTLEMKNHHKNHITSQDDAIRMTTALHIACLNGQYEAVQYLLTKVKLDANYQDRTGSTALMYAAWKGHFKIVKYLIKEHNADHNITNFKNGTTKRYAKYAGHDKIAKYLDKL